MNTRRNGKKPLEKANDYSEDSEDSRALNDTMQAQKRTDSN